MPVAYAKLSQTDHSAAGVTVDPGGLVATMSTGHCRLGGGNSSGKRQVDCINGGGVAQIVVCLCLLASGIDAVINGANHYTYDGTGVLSVPPGWGAGVAAIGAGDVISMCGDLDAHTASVYKNGALLGGWAGLPAGMYSVLFGSTTAIASAGLTILTDPAAFLFPVATFTGFTIPPQSKFLNLF